MAIFNSYVSLPEGISILEDKPESEIWCDDSYHGKGHWYDIGYEAGLLASVWIIRYHS